MSFSKAQKNLHENINFNPPPGHYQPEPNTKLYQGQTTFGKQSRFQAGSIQISPGPGTYSNDRRQKVRKRILDEAKKRQNGSQPQSNSQIKISSIPSIPKKSATRVYEELAPGILILHEEQNQNTNIGPGSYNPKFEVQHKKPVAHKINPQHKKKIQSNNEPQVKIPTLAEEIRNEKRLMYKKNLIKSSGINRSMISPADLCLEKLLRSDEAPPPGYYYNEKYQSSFKPTDTDLPAEYQLLMGKEERFKQPQIKYEIGPGSYENGQAQQQNGGFIPKEERNLHQISKINPGPGSYKVQSIQRMPTDAKGAYPPIFGSGCNRFYSADSKITATPGPGSYKVDAPKKKKMKYLKIKKDFYDSQFSKTAKPELPETDELFGKSGNKSGASQYSTEYGAHKKKQKNTHNFSSKVERFNHEKNNETIVGPGNYNPMAGSFNKPHYNKNKQGYVGSKEARFDGPIIRPNIGPGTYDSNYNSIKEKKHINVKL